MRDLYNNFLNDILENYRQIFKGFNSFFLKKASYPEPNQNLHRYFNRNSIKGRIVTYTDPKKISHIVWLEIIKLDSTRKIFDYIIKNDLSPFEKVSFEEDIRRQPSITKNLIADFVGRMSELNRYSLDFNKIVFDKAFSELNEFLLSDRFKYKILVNLYGPLGELDIIPVDNAYIKKADYKIAKLFCFHHFDSEMTEYEMFENDYYIEIEREIIKKNWCEELRNEQDIIEKLFNCLILSSPGNIEIGKSLRLSSAWPLIKTERINYNPTQNKYGKTNIFRYEFNDKSKLLLKENSEKLRTINYEKLDDSIKASFKRIKKSKSTFEIEDKIIELVLSIEYLINTTTYEVTLQLCLKIIKMYNDSNQDETLFKLLKDFLTLRGNVLHGNKKVLATSANVRLIQRVEEITLNILLKYVILNQKYTFKEINKSLDKSLYLDKSIEEILKSA